MLRAAHDPAGADPIRREKRPEHTDGDVIMLLQEADVGPAASGQVFSF